MTPARAPGLLLAGLLLAMPAPAAAHKLKVFAAAEDGEIVGYAFFVGGSRPKGAAYEITSASGERLHAGRTDAAGGFRWAVPGPGAYVVTVDAGDGHAAATELPAARFGGGAAASGAAPSSPAPAPRASETEALVAAAVQREILPVLERLEAMDSRMRFTDVVSGVFLLIGAAGGLLWLRGPRGK